MRGDSLVVEPLYTQIGLHDNNRQFHTDTVSPLGYAEVLYGKKENPFWNVIDMDGNFLFPQYFSTPCLRAGAYFLGKDRSGNNCIFNLRGREMLRGNYVEPIYKKNSGGWFGIWAVVDSLHPKTILFDMKMDTLMCIEGDYRPQFQTHDNMIFALKYSGSDPDLFLTVNAKGEMGMKLNDPIYPYPVTDYANEKELALLTELYGPVPPPLLLRKNTDKYNYVYFLDSLIYDKAPRLNTFEKSIKKAWKNLYPIISTPEFAEYFKKQYLAPAQELTAYNEKTVADSVVSIHAPKVEIIERDGKKYFMHGGQSLKYNLKGYDEVIPVDRSNIYIAYQDSLCWAVSQTGTRFVGPCEFIERLPLTGKYGAPALLVREGGKTSVRSTAGLLFSERYDDIIPVTNTTGAVDGFYFLKDNKWAYAPFSNLRSPAFYEYITPFDEEGYAYVYIDGHEGKINKNGKKVVNVCASLFKSAEDTQKSPAERIAIYKYITDLSSKVDEARYRAPSYRKMAQLYEKGGYIDEAINAYEWAEINGDDSAGREAKRLKTDKIVNALNAVASSLNDMAAALGGNPSEFSVTPGAYSSSWGNASASGSSLQGQYRNWERRAQSVYESLTNSGYQVKKNKKDVGGSAAGTRAPSSFLARKRLLREAQNEMEKIRRKDPSIQKSPYESVSVSF